MLYEIAIIAHFNSSLNPMGRLSSPTARQDLEREDDEYVNMSAHGDSGDDFELEDLSGMRTHRKKPADNFDPQSGDSESDDEEPALSLRARRTSVSTVQSFMLYTPNEEKAVIKKFDRRLVLFVAFLYMLSFLDRSSM